MDGDGPIASNAFIGAFIDIHRHLRRFPCPVQDAPCAHDAPFDVAKDFQTLIAQRQSTMPQLEQRLAVYLRSNPDAILVDTSNTIAERAFVSPMTVTRFFRKLGFDSAAAV